MDNEYLSINGGNELRGTVEMHGAKNAVLPLLAAAAMTKEESVIEDCPFISDVENMLGLLSALGVSVKRKGRNIELSGGVSGVGDIAGFCKTMRSSMFMLGVLLSETGEAYLPLPGGCDIGARPLDIHIDGLKKMGAEAYIENGAVVCKAKKLRGAEIPLRYPSVGATENLLMCAARADGRTTLLGCAREPEIVSLADGLNKMGANIRGAGSSKIEIEGVKTLKGARLIPGGDRIVAGTVLAATALCGGSVKIDGVNRSELAAVINAFKSEHCKIDGTNTGICVSSDGRISAGSVFTAPYPLFPTDMQAQYLACQCFSDGVGVVRETVFENRFAHAYELQKMGADVIVDKNAAFVRGNPRGMKAAELCAHDLRGGAGLMIAALKVRGESKVFGTRYIDRGYESMETLFRELGADVSRVRV